MVMLLIVCCERSFMLLGFGLVWNSWSLLWFGLYWYCVLWGWLVVWWNVGIGCSYLKVCWNLVLGWLVVIYVCCVMWRIVMLYDWYLCVERFVVSLWLRFCFLWVCCSGYCWWVWCWVFFYVFCCVLFVDKNVCVYCISILGLLFGWNVLV